MDVDRIFERWLDAHGVEDKDGHDPGEGGAEAARARDVRRIREMQPQATIDLHGMTAREAEPALKAFLASSSSRGLEKVLIIHGKGNHSAGSPVMQGLVRKILEGSDVAGSFGPAGRESGGRGATWARIRRKDYFSR